MVTKKGRIPFPLWAWRVSSTHADWSEELQHEAEAAGEGVGRAGY